jgi:hypothetical protein
MLKYGIGFWGWGLDGDYENGPVEAGGQIIFEVKLAGEAGKKWKNS